MVLALNSVAISGASTADDASRLMRCGRVSVDSVVHDGCGWPGACASQHDETPMPSRRREEELQAACQIEQGSGDERAENGMNGLENRDRTSLWLLGVFLRHGRCSCRHRSVSPQVSARKRSESPQSHGWNLVQRTPGIARETVVR